MSRAAMAVAALALALAGGAAVAGEPGEAGPRFAPRPMPLEHVYSGGWEHFVGGGLAVLDCDGDGRPEMFAAGGAGPARLFRNRSGGGALRFEPAPEGSVPALTGVTGAYPLDIDGDGRLDLAVLRDGANLLLRGTGDCRFTDASDAWGFEGGAAWTTAFSATWEPGQNWPTLVFGNYVDRADPKGPFGACAPHALYRPRPGGGYGPPEALAPGYCTLSMLFADWQRRGRQDLWISNDRHYYAGAGTEQMYRLDEARFLGPGDGWEPLSIWGMGVAARDLTGDGRPEVMLTSMGDQLLRIAGPEGYSAAPYAIGTYAQRPHTGGDARPSTGWHAAFGDVDNDGLADLFIAKGNVDQMPEAAMADPNNLLMQRPGGSFEEHAASAGVASVHRGRGAALADLDGDGRLDLAVVNRGAPLELWRNVTEGAGNWVQLAPRQPGGNRNAVGALVELRTPAGTQVQEVTVGGGHAGGAAVPLHFGLGKAERAEARVRWPGGQVSPWVQIDAGSRLALERGPDGALRPTPLP